MKNSRWTERLTKQYGWERKRNLFSTAYEARVADLWSREKGNKGIRAALFVQLLEDQEEFKDETLFVGTFLLGGTWGYIKLSLSPETISSTLGCTKAMHHASATTASTHSLTLGASSSARATLSTAIESLFPAIAFCRQNRHRIRSHRADLPTVRRQS